MSTIQQRRHKIPKGFQLNSDVVEMIEELRDMLQRQYPQEDFGVITGSAVVEACIRFAYSQRSTRLRHIAEA